MDLQSGNASDSSDHVVKIADRLGCLGWSVHTGRKNPRRRKIVKIPDFTIVRTSGNQALISGPSKAILDRQKVVLDREIKGVP